MKIAVRLFSSGSRDRRQSATLRVRIVSPGAVRSQATVSIVCGAQSCKSCSASFTLR